MWLQCWKLGMNVCVYKAAFTRLQFYDLVKSESQYVSWIIRFKQLATTFNTLYQVKIYSYEHQTQGLIFKSICILDSQIQTVGVNIQYSIPSEIYSYEQQTQSLIFNTANTPEPEQVPSVQEYK